ncbi:hypothetical protein IIA28_18755 [candidate division KSB1 bacterium]|nr:hypothetical protein [candidate division KSB1 bacterium]
MKGKHITFVVLGVLLFIGGLVVFLMRTELAVNWIGRGVAFREALLGGAYLNRALTIIVAGSVTAMLVGCLLVIFGLVFGLSRKEVVEAIQAEKPTKKLASVERERMSAAVNKKDAVFPATVLFILGIFFIVRNFGLFSFDYYFYGYQDFWPIFLIAFGLGVIATAIVSQPRRKMLFPGCLLLCIGLIFLLSILFGLG